MMKFSDLEILGWKILKNEQNMRYCYQTPIRKGFRKKIFQRRDLEPEDQKFASILFPKSMCWAGGQEENFDDLTFVSKDCQQAEREKDGESTFSETIQNSGKHTKEKKESFFENCDSNENKCHLCLKIFSRKPSLQLHMKRHQGLSRTVSCPNCFYKSEKNSDMLKHIKRKHMFEANTDKSDPVNKQVQDSLMLGFKDGNVVGDKANVESNLDKGKGQNPSLKLKKLVTLICGKGVDTDERVLYIWGSNISLLKVPQNLPLDRPRTPLLEEIGRKDLEFEVFSVAVYGNTAVLAGEKQVAVIRFGLNSPEIVNNFVSHKSEIVKTELTRISSKLYWLVGTREAVQIFGVEDNGALTHLTFLLTSDLVTFTVDTHKGRLFLLERSGTAWATALLPEDGLLLPGGGATAPGALVQVSEGRYSSIFFSESQGQLLLVCQESQKILCGTVSMEGCLTTINKVREVNIV